MRQVEPLRLTYSGGAWYLTAYCRLRAAERVFRLDRIEEFRPERERFKPRPPMEKPDGTGIEVIVRFRGDAVRWVRERQHWSYAGDVPTAEGVSFRYRPDDLDEMAPWLFSWGAAAEVLAPQELRELLRSEAQNVLQMLT
jgi:predicted DNA-binding transcriptional regulator YafY